MSVAIRYQARCLEFPQELSDNVFETLRNDSSSLKHCSLVCKAWLQATRRYLFRQVTLTPRNIDPFTVLVVDSCSTVSPHVRKLELRRINCSNRLLSNFTSILTHLHLCDTTFHAFIDILDIICSFPYLQSVALDGLTVETNSVDKSARVQNKVLPSSVNTVRCRNGCVRPFLSWLTHHVNVPKLSGFDIGPVEEESTLEFGRYLFYAGPVVEHISFFIDFDIGNAPICVLPRKPIGLEYIKTSVSTPLSIAERYKAHFGLEVSPNMSTLTGLQSVRIENFIHFEDRIQHCTLLWCPRVIASVQSTKLREVVLGVSLRNAGEVDRFNIRWDFLDEAFANMDGPYKNLVSLKFAVAGTVNMDGFASLIRSRMPGCSKRGFLQFCRDN